MARFSAMSVASGWIPRAADSPPAPPLPSRRPAPPQRLSRRLSLRGRHAAQARRRGGWATIFDLAGKSEMLIGREDPVSNIYPDVDLTPHGGEEGGVSRLHAKIYIAGRQYMVEDQNSTNFTFVNKQKLAPKTPTPIKDGDEIRLGRVALLFKTS